MVRKLRDCRDFASGKIARVPRYTIYNNMRIVEREYKFGKILPMDEALAAERYPEENRIIEKCCVISRNIQYYYIEFTRELNQTNPDQEDNDRQFVDAIYVQILKTKNPVEDTNTALPEQIPNTIDS
jgi:hypothetical protein